MTRIQSLKLLLLVSALAMAGCSPKVDNRGYVPNITIKDEVAVGKTTKDEVLEKLGSPSVQSSFGEETWYYVSARKETVAFLKPEVVEQEVVRITFDNAGVVSKIENFDKNSSQDFSFVKRTTPTEGHQMGFLEQILGNIGRFNKSGSDTAAPGRKPH